MSSTANPLSLIANLAARIERRITFRVERGFARWFKGLPDDIQQLKLPVRCAQGIQNIHAWWCPAVKENAPAVLYLHGAKWNLTGHLFRISQLRDFGFSVLAIDYRGFGQSDGDLPSEQTVYEDAKIAWDYLSDLQPNPARRYIYGHSLGAAVAIELAVRLAQAPTGSNPAPVPAANGLILDASFTALIDVAKWIWWKWLPVRHVMRQKFDSVGKIANVGLPVLFIHGTQDQYLPAKFSEALYAAAQTPKTLLLVPGATHNNSLRVGRAAFRHAFHDLFGWKPHPAWRNIDPQP